MVFTFAHEGHDHATEVMQAAQSTSVDPSAVAGALCLLIAAGILAYAFMPKTSPKKTKSTKTAKVVSTKAKAKKPVKKTAKKK